MFVLAHLSDPHIPPRTPPVLRSLVSKRILGWANWQRGRKHVHRRPVLDALTAAVRTHGPDHIAVTGDLAIVSTPGEWADGRAWLDGFAAPDTLSLIPGNHDAYARGALAGALSAWDPYLRGDHQESRGPARFPYLRRRGPVAIIGCSSAVVTPPFIATGRLGAPQLDALDKALAGAADDGLFRVVLIHHPPLAFPGDAHRRLTDRDSVRDILASRGAELVLHGHEHTESLGWAPGPQQPVPVIGVPSASAEAHGHWPAAGYNLYEITGRPGGWDCTMRRFGLRADGFAETETTQLYRSGQPNTQATASSR